MQALRPRSSILPGQLEFDGGSRMTWSAIALIASAVVTQSPRAEELYARSQSDPVLLATLGVTFILLAILLRGFAQPGSPEDSGFEQPGEDSPAHFEVLPVDFPAPASKRGRVCPLLSVDVEDYFQTEAMSLAGHRARWNEYPLRVEKNTRKILDLFDEFGVKGTFFTVGWIADRVPALVREIAARGHELACHSYWHRTVYSLAPDEFRRDTRQAVDAIAQAAGVRVNGYRAPTWSITRRSLWAIQILAEEGFAYDSSIYPIHHDLYGIPGAMAKPHVWKVDGYEIIEIPPATYSIGDFRCPAAGGGYLRAFPLRFSCMALDQLARRQALPVVYMHPWEFDPDQPRLQAPWKARMRQYHGLNSFESKLRQLLARYQFVPFRDRWMEVLESAPKVPVELAAAAVTS